MLYSEMPQQQCPRQQHKPREDHSWELDLLHQWTFVEDLLTSDSLVLMTRYLDLILILLIWRSDQMGKLFRSIQEDEVRLLARVLVDGLVEWCRERGIEKTAPVIEVNMGV